MSSRQTDENARFIWATRGRSWGFRFLRRGGLEDPLRTYDTMFAGLEDEQEAWRREGQDVALRFSDPSGRQDAAGRVISHDFVLLGSWADGVNSLDDGRRLIWPKVADEFDDVWNRSEAPSDPA